MNKNIFKKSMAAIVSGLLLTSLAAPAFAATYQIQKDDTLFQIAKERNIPLQKVFSANPGIDPLNLQIGSNIQLPDAKPAAPVVKPAAPVVKPMVKGAAIKPANVITTPAGKDLTYGRTLTAVATAYTASPAENGGWAGLDYMGNRLKVGTIAVDPSVIPLGSTVYITGYNSPYLPAKGMIAKATDIGGAIKGNRVDIFVPSSNASSFGLQNVKIYVLK